MMTEATMDEDNGVKVDGCLVNLGRFAYDKAILVNCLHELTDNNNRVTHS